MKRLTFLILTASACCCLFSIGSAWAQSQTQPNYEYAARYSAKKLEKMVFSTTVSPQWFRNSDHFWYTYKTSAGTQWYVVDPAQGIKKELFDLDDIAARLTEITKDPFNATDLPLKDLKMKDDQTFTFFVTSSEMVEVKKEAKDGEKVDKPKKENRTFYFEYDWKSRKLTWLEDKEKETRFPMWASVSPDKAYVVFGRNYNLYWMDWENFEKARKDDKDSTIVEHQITTTGTRDKAFASSFRDDDDTTALKQRTGVYGLVWSPDSKHFALTVSDNSKVKDLWVINSLANPRPKLERYKYEMPGETGMPLESLLLFTMGDTTYRTVDVSAFKDQTIGVMRKPMRKRDFHNEFNPRCWEGTDNMFFLSRISRDLKRQDICRVSIDADSLVAVPLVEERSNVYLETSDVCFTNDYSEFVYWCERSGWAHLYLYNADGTLKNAITKGPWHVSRILEIDNTNRYVYFTACGREAGENPYYEHVYRAKLDGSQIQRVTKGHYFQTPNMPDDLKYIVTDNSRIDTIPFTDLYDAAGRKIMRLETADLSLLLASGYQFPEQFTVKAADGVTDLYGVMYKPFDFDPSRSYPIIDYVYPGPQVEGPYLTWSSRMDRLDRLAQIGFVVISVGNRGGHPNRSVWYHTYGYHNLRDYGLADQKYAIEQLAARHKFLDISRVGIHGHSGGGFMSTAAILTYPDFFKVAVSCAGNHENNIYNRWWSEKHHGVTEEITAKGDTTFKYNIDKNSELAPRLKGHLLLVHGDIDNNVHPANTMRVVNALIRANKRFDMLILPGQRHGFGDMSDYFFWKMADYYAKYFLGTSETSVDIPQMNNDD